MFAIKSDKIICDGRLTAGCVYVDDGKIVRIGREDKTVPTYDYTGNYVSAGFIDMHTHGAGGHAFINSTPKDVVEGCNFHLQHGTTTIVPTISAGPFPNMKKAVADIDAAMHSDKKKGHILGAHLEGPYLSAAQCGAQCPDFITPPVKEEYESLISEYGDSIVRWTYAPENDKDGTFCQYITSHGIVASAGHTDAKYDDIKTAISCGCNLITHLYSCTSTVTRDHGFRSLGVIESAFLRDELYVEIIADGKHLPPDLIHMILKIKGKEKVALITDSLEIAGTDIKEGVMSGTPFLVEDGVCKLRDRSAFAGSIATSDCLIRTLVNDCHVDMATAVYMLTKVPAEILHLNKGDIQIGRDADIIVFDDNVTMQDIFIMGNKIEQ